MLKGKKVAVTGGAGFIGSNIVERLVSYGNEVVVIDNFLTGRMENIGVFKDDIRLVNGSIQDLGLLRTEFKGVDYVLHQAALPSVPRSIDDPIATNQNNIDGTLNVLVAAKDSGVKRVVYAASSSAYGNTLTLPKHEGMSPDPLSPYAISKLAGEQYCKVFYDIYGLETVALRYFNVFGPRQDPNSHYAAVIPKFIKNMLSGESPVIFGDGEQSRDFTYVQNNVDANLLACTAANAPGKVFNIACGSRISLNELVMALNDIIGTDIEPAYAAERPGDVKHSLADITRARDILGYKPTYVLAEGLARTVEWFKKH
ncbi:SDR family oxidoreductase [Methanolobus psychrotolerans]|uniref:SDR family oxidoreductase n=1 Tax=Methanolobus psychrotolerans TaxID=1874706 RepID=UPI000B91B1D1|nr:SDR family oxidoreductase [Methanolobus psychrotolerans]